MLLHLIINHIAQGYIVSCIYKQFINGDDCHSYQVFMEEQWVHEWMLIKKHKNIVLTKIPTIHFLLFLLLINIRIIIILF